MTTREETHRRWQNSSRPRRIANRKGGRETFSRRPSVKQSEVGTLLEQDRNGPWNLNARGRRGRRVGGGIMIRCRFLLPSSRARVRRANGFVPQPERGQHGANARRWWRLKASIYRFHRRISTAVQQPATRRPSRPVLGSHPSLSAFRQGEKEGVVDQVLSDDGEQSPVILYEGQ